MRVHRLPVVIFVLAVAASTSAVAAAAGWFRVNTGNGSENYGGGGEGCFVATSGSYSNANAWVCPIPDNYTITGYTGATAYFQNSNHTQPAAACVAYFNRVGDICTNTNPNNCSGGVCQVVLNTSQWTTNSNDFKYILFDNMTVGVSLPGFSVFTTP